MKTSKTKNIVKGNSKISDYFSKTTEGKTSPNRQHQKETGQVPTKTKILEHVNNNKEKHVLHKSKDEFGRNTNATHNPKRFKFDTDCASTLKYDGPKMEVNWTSEPSYIPVKPSVSNIGTLTCSPNTPLTFEVHTISNKVLLSPSTKNNVVSEKLRPTLDTSTISENLAAKRVGRVLSLNLSDELEKRPPLKVVDNLILNDASCDPALRVKAADKSDTCPGNSNNTENSAIIKMESVEESLLKENSFNDDSDIAFNELALELEASLDLKEAKHCKILEVVEVPKGIGLRLQATKTGECGICNVRGFWISNRFTKGNSVFISAGKTDSGEWCVDNETGCIVYEPDFLVSCTSVVNTVFCKRKSVLQEYYGMEGGNRVMTVGVVVHSLLQTVLRQKLRDAAAIEAVLHKLLHSKTLLHKLYECGLSLDEVKTEARLFLPRILEFVRCYIDGAAESDHNWKGRILNIDDIEENIWCPELGVKGKIDVSVTTNQGQMPLELKTGRATMSIEHRGQLMLYISMMRKLGYKVSTGLMLYLREGVVKDVSISPKEERDIMILRNDFAYYLTSSIREIGSKTPLLLPEPIDRPRVCSKCAHNVLCTAFMKRDGFDLSKIPSFTQIHADVSGHFSEAHLDYLIHWSSLLLVEAESSLGQKSIREIYTIPPKDREKSGKCIANLTIVSTDERINDEGLCYQRFAKQGDVFDNFLTSGIQENSYIVVSTDTRPAVATGFVTSITSSSITVALERNLGQKFAGKTFHLDTYDSASMRFFNMTNLALLLSDTPRATELRSIIIDKKEPTFLEKLPSVVVKKGSPILRRLNRCQQRAVLKALSAEQYLLINGMPGTGKSSTIVALIQLMVELGKTVIITSHTHSAVDNVCLRLHKLGVDFLRLGNESRVHGELKARSEHTLTRHCKTLEELQAVYDSAKVVAVTCLGSGHPLLSKRTFDLCIVDESTQVTQTSVFRVLNAAKVFLLVGDPDQLPPVVKNRDALEAGMSESLFERLMTPKTLISLDLNYRMNRTITALANAFTYKGQLKIGNEAVAKSTLKIPNFSPLKSHDYSKQSWILKALNCKLEASVQIIDTGPVWKQSGELKWLLEKAELPEMSEDNCTNSYEAAIVTCLVKALLKCGVTNNDIGVIATYRAQVFLLSALLSTLDVAVSTVDHFQGQDKSIIIYSCTKSKGPQEKGKYELLEDKRRLTVAITRAKHKLIIVGDLSTIRRYKMVTTFLKSLDEKEFINFGEDFEWDSLKLCTL